MIEDADHAGFTDDEDSQTIIELKCMTSLACSPFSGGLIVRYAECRHAEHKPSCSKDQLKPVSKTERDESAS